MKSNEYKSGDKVIIIENYPNITENPWYPVGTVVTLTKRLYHDSPYWYTDRFPDSHQGVFERCFVKYTKLAKALM